MSALPNKTIKRGRHTYIRRSQEKIKDASPEKKHHIKFSYIAEMRPKMQQSKKVKTVSYTLHTCINTNGAINDHARSHSTVSS